MIHRKLIGSHAFAVLVSLMLSAITLGFGGRTAEAALIVFTDRSSWETSIGSFAAESFATTELGDLDPPPDVNVYNFFTATIDANDSGLTAIVEPGAVNGSREFQARISTDFPNDPSFIDVDLFGSILGIGADFVGATDGDSLTLTIGAETVQFDQHLSGNGDGFLGVISTTPFNALTLGTENPSLFGEAFALDDVSFGPVTAPIPEPSSVMVWSLGLVWLLFGRRRFAR